MAEVVIVAPSRIHFGLIDLSTTGHRKYGGAGVMLSEPCTVLRVEPAASFKVSAPNADAEHLNAAVAAASRLEHACGPMRCSVLVEKHAPAHVGLGSKTSLLLAILFAINVQSRLGLSTNYLQKLSGRGGTSGIGINGFFSGGFVVDGGHVADNKLGPSSAASPTYVPPILSNFDVPPTWRFALLLPAGRRLSSTSERDFFSRNTPVPSMECLATLAAVHHGLAPGYATGNLELVRLATAEIQRLGFKRRELEAQTDSVRSLLNRLHEIETVACGLSSLGPLIYVVHDMADTDALMRAQQCAVAWGADYLGDVSASPSGVVSVDLQE